MSIDAILFDSSDHMQDISSFQNKNYQLMLINRSLGLISNAKIDNLVKKANRTIDMDNEPISTEYFTAFDSLRKRAILLKLIATV